VTHHSLPTREKKCHGDAFQADCCVKMLFLSQFFYSTVTSGSWLTCWKWTAMMTLHFRQQNRVDGDGSWWRFFVAFLVIFFVHSTGILRRIGTKHEILVRKSRENPLEKNLSIVIRFVVVSILTRTSYVDELSSIKYILGTLRNSNVKEY
jgi:hypothetical protein